MQEPQQIMQGPGGGVMITHPMQHQQQLALTQQQSGPPLSHQLTPAGPSQAQRAVSEAQSEDLGLIAHIGRDALQRMADAPGEATMAPWKATALMLTTGALLRIAGVHPEQVSPQSGERIEAVVANWVFPMIQDFERTMMQHGDPAGWQNPAHMWEQLTDTINQAWMINVANHMRHAAGMGPLSEVEDVANAVMRFRTQLLAATPLIEFQAGTTTTKILLTDENVMRAYSIMVATVANISERMSNEAMSAGDVANHLKTMAGAGPDALMDPRNAHGLLALVSNVKKQGRADVAEIQAAHAQYLRVLTAYTVGKDEQYKVSESIVARQAMELEGARNHVLEVRAFAAQTQSQLQDVVQERGEFGRAAIEAVAGARQDRDAALNAEAEAMNRLNVEEERSRVAEAQSAEAAIEAAAAVEATVRARDDAALSDELMRQEADEVDTALKQSQDEVLMQSLEIERFADDLEKAHDDAMKTHGAAHLHGAIAAHGAEMIERIAAVHPGTEEAALVYQTIHQELQQMIESKTKDAIFALLATQQRAAAEAPAIAAAAQDAAVKTEALDALHGVAADDAAGAAQAADDAAMRVEAAVQENEDTKGQLAMLQLQHEQMRSQLREASVSTAGDYPSQIEALEVEVKHLHGQLLSQDDNIRHADLEAGRTLQEAQAAKEREASLQRQLLMSQSQVGMLTAALNSHNNGIRTSGAHAAASLDSIGEHEGASELRAELDIPRSGSVVEPTSFPDVVPTGVRPLSQVQAGPPRWTAAQADISGIRALAQYYAEAWNRAAAMQVV